MTRRPLEIGRLVLIWAINMASLMLLAALLPGFSIERWGGGLALAAPFGLLNALVWPLLIRVALPLTVISLAQNYPFILYASDLQPRAQQLVGDSTG